MRLMLEALRDLRAHRVKSLLSVVSLFIGVTAVVAIYTVGAITEDVFVAHAEQASGRAITIAARLRYGPLSATRVATILAALDRRVVALGGSYALVANVPAEVGLPAERTELVDYCRRM